MPWGMPNVDVVITAFNQGTMVRDAVQSVAAQTLPVSRVILVDDGSSDPASLEALAELASAGCGRGTVQILRQPNSGVSAARNGGLAQCRSEFVLILDGDDRVTPTFVERTSRLLSSSPDVLAASSWLRMFGAAQAVVRPSGGTVENFLGQNRCPATALLRRDAWARTTGYDESMRRGFEDWEFFIRLLSDGGRIEIVPAALLEYRTAPQSANLTSMDARRELLEGIIARHLPLYREHFAAVVLDMDAGRTHHLLAWESLVSTDPTTPLNEATFGDGGMAALVRAQTTRASQAGRPSSL